MSQIEWTRYPHGEYDGVAPIGLYEAWREGSAWSASVVMKDGFTLTAGPFKTLRKAKAWCEEQQGQSQ